MAELKPWFDKWKKVLKEWNMRESTVIQGWIDRGKVETVRDNSRTILAARFGTVPTEILRRIDESTDFGQLDRAFEQALVIARPEDLPL